MSERGETRDFMSVDAFSQLPFIRPATTSRPPPSSSSSAAAIRLFGIEFPSDTDPDTTDCSKDSTSANTNSTSATNGGGSATASAAAETTRKFECHYCCRNFPTSQALGGHQNAHKRERQHAKRAHLQSAMAAAAAAAAHHNPPVIADNHVYGLLNYHRALGSVVPSAARFGLGHTFEPPPPPPPSHYPSWNTNPAGARFYGGLGSAAQPITGSPLPGLWRVPAATVHGGATLAAPVAPPMTLRGVVVDNALGSSSSSSTSPPGRRAATGGGGKDSNVSLDLHL